MSDDPNSYPSVTEILGPFFEATYGPLQESLGFQCPWCGGWIGGNDYTRRGHFVGDLMDELVQGHQVTRGAIEWFYEHPTWIPFLTAGRKYLAENPPAERPVTQLRMVDRLQKVRGKPDWLWLEDGKVTDVKTGTGKPPDWLGMQTGQYALLADMHFGRRFYKREILWLKDTGEYEIVLHENPFDAADFNDLLRAEWVKRARMV